MGRRTGERNWEKGEEDRRSEIYLRMDKDLENGGGRQKKKTRAGRRVQTAKGERKF